MAREIQIELCYEGYGYSIEQEVAQCVGTDQEGAEETGAVVPVGKAMCSPGPAPLVSVNCLKSRDCNNRSREGLGIIGRARMCLCWRSFYMQRARG